MKISRLPLLPLFLVPAVVLCSACGDVTHDSGETGSGGVAPAAWHRQIGGPGEEMVIATAIDRDGNVIVAGSSAGWADLGEGVEAGKGAEDLFVTKFSADGGTVFSKRFAANHVLCSGIAADADGNIALTGAYYGGSLTVGETLPVTDVVEHAYVAKLGPDGEPLWARDVGSDEFSVGGAVAFRPNGEIVVAGNRGMELFVVDLSPSGEVVFDAAPGTMFGNSWPSAAIRSIAVAGDGALFVTGSYGGNAALGPLAETGNPLTRGVIAKLRGTDATPLWARSFGEGMTYSNAGNNVLADADGDALVAGFAIGDPYPGEEPAGGAMFLARFSGATGEPIWVTPFGSSETVGALAGLDSEGNPMLVGSLQEAGDVGGVDLPAGTFLARARDATGEIEHARAVTEIAGRLTLAVGPSDEAVLAATFYDVDPMKSSLGPLKSAGMGDVLVVGLGPQ